jgi:hypothetical protein
MGRWSADEGRDGDRVVIAAVRERRPPFSPDDVVLEFTALLKSYGVTSVKGDKYGGDWPSSRFQAHGVTYEPIEIAKSDLYRDLLPVINAGRVELLDLPRLSNQLIALERRTARSGKDSIDHPQNGRDDVINAVAGAVCMALTGAAPIDWGAVLAEVRGDYRARSGFAGVMPGNAAFPHTHRHLP